MAKKKNFVVSFERTVRFTAEVEVEATSATQAEALATKMVDEPRANFWREGDIVDEQKPVTREA